MRSSTSPIIRLDSSPPGGRWTFLPRSPASRWIIWRRQDEAICLYENSIAVATWQDPLAALQWLEQAAREPGRPRSRWIGFLSYDLGRCFEKVPALARDDLELPLLLFGEFDRSDGSAMAGAPSETVDVLTSDSSIQSTFSKSQYLRAVNRAIEYIAGGDVFQVNLAQRFTLPQPASVNVIYDRLLRAAPARHGALLEWNGISLLCNSPELFLKVTSDASTGLRSVITRPIKGTRPRQPGMEAQLRDSIKDQAELNMIVDLERNDLGRVCQVGSVKVTEPRTIEAHPTVFHGVATVKGILRPDVGLAGLIHATFPGGSITGAAEIRAMEIIEELEPVRRGPYCGAIGYLDCDGSMEFNIAIRTMIVKDQKVHLSVGGGIVADSDPQAEYEETLVKAQAMFGALGICNPVEIQPA